MTANLASKEAGQRYPDDISQAAFCAGAAWAIVEFELSEWSRINKEKRSMLLSLYRYILDKDIGADRKDWVQRVAERVDADTFPDAFI